MGYNPTLLDMIDGYVSQLENGDVRLEQIEGMNQHNISMILTYCEINKLKDDHYLNYYFDKWAEALKKYNKRGEDVGNI